MLRDSANRVVSGGYRILLFAAVMAARILSVFLKEMLFVHQVIER
jgi:hypothetical protein